MNPRTLPPSVTQTFQPAKQSFKMSIIRIMLSWGASRHRVPKRCRVKDPVRPSHLSVLTFGAPDPSVLLAAQTRAKPSIDYPWVSPTTHSLRGQPKPRYDLLDRLEHLYVIKQSLHDHAHIAPAELPRILTWRASTFLKNWNESQGRLRTDHSPLLPGQQGIFDLNSGDSPKLP